MRMDDRTPLTAAELIRRSSEEKLSEIFLKYGEEWRARQIARKIVATRRKEPIRTTTALARLVAECFPAERKARARIHPATKVFQALRIAVNGELEALESGVRHAFRALRSGGRLVVITFHSLEDRIVKTAMRAYAREGKAKILTTKPVRPETSEIQRNPRARSARLRAAETI
jgi:16S rRNA (cytosine1402-N4)-methyltransferase